MVQKKVVPGTRLYFYLIGNQKRCVELGQSYENGAYEEEGTQRYPFAQDDDIINGVEQALGFLKAECRKEESCRLYTELLN